MKLYIANTTKQSQIIYFRLDIDGAGARITNSAGKAPKMQAIAPGRQVAIAGDLHFRQVEDIVEQLKKYGLIGVVDVPRMKGKVPNVFNTELPVPAEIIRRVDAHNQGIQIIEGKDRRAKAAIVVNDMVEKKVANELMAAAGGPIEADQTQPLEIEIEQETQSEAGEKMVAEGYRIDANARPGGAPSPSQKAGSRRRKAA